MSKSKKETSQVEEKNVEVVEEEESTLYYFYSVGCGFCKKAEPIVDELNKEGHNILKLDLSEKDNQGLKQELSKKYNKQCGTPWFIDGSTGNQICGFREKDIVEKWVNGEDIPAPPRPNGMPPRPPFMDASDEDLEKWEKSHLAWLKNNEHLPEERRKSVEEILEMPRPKSAPPLRPNIQECTDDDIDKWGKEYQNWKTENSHIPTLQPSATVVQSLREAKNRMQMQQQSAPMSPNQEARLTRLEQKMDKLIKHLGVK
jgi:thiol-disulfide isomerase/thioredoxin